MALTKCPATNITKPPATRGHGSQGMRAVEEDCVEMCCDIVYFRGKIFLDIRIAFIEKFHPLATFRGTDRDCLEPIYASSNLKEALLSW